MRWPIKPKNPLKRRFAIIPVQIDDNWVWLEWYYVHTEMGPGGATMIARFHTYEEGVRWLNDYNNF